MSQLISACGLICSDCDAYKATQANDAEAVARIAQAWSAQFHAEIRPEHVWCDGCMTEGPRKCGHVGECKIRICVVERGLENCAACSDYACAQLEGFFGMVPQARTTLDGLRG